MATQEELVLLEELAQSWVVTQSPWLIILGGKVLLALEDHPQKSVKQIVALARRRVKADFDRAAEDFQEQWTEMWEDVTGDD